MKWIKQLPIVSCQLTDFRKQKIVNRKLRISFSQISFYILHFAFYIFLLSSCNNSPKYSIKIDGQQQFADSAVSSIKSYVDKEGELTIVKNNASYDLVSVIDNENKFNVLLKILKSEITSKNAAVTKNEFMISANTLDEKNSTKINWQQKITANDINYESKVLIAHTEAVGDSTEDTYTLYSIFTGEKLMTYTYGELKALIPNTSQKRFFGYRSQKANSTDKLTSFAEINFVSIKAILNTIVVNLIGDKKLPAYTPEMQMMLRKESGNSLTNDGKSVILSKLDEHYTAKDITGFALQINYYAEGDTAPISIVLPVENDKVDLKNAIYNRSVFELKEK